MKKKIVRLLIGATLLCALAQILTAIAAFGKQALSKPFLILFVLLFVVQLCLAAGLIAYRRRQHPDEMQALTRSVLQGFQEDDAEAAAGGAVGNLHLAMQMLETQSEIMALQNQINPHFLYNTLETIRGKALSHGDTEVANMIEVLARLFRYNISRNDEKATLADELENVRNCIAIHNYRFRNRFILEEKLLDIEDLQERYSLPILTLQPIVENAIHHGLEPKLGTGNIRIHTFLTEHKLVIVVEDDGVGMSDEVLRDMRARLHQPNAAPMRRHDRKQSSGIALVNVQRRLQLMFGQAYGLDVMSKENIGTTVRIVLPYPLENGVAYET